MKERLGKETRIWAEGVWDKIQRKMEPECERVGDKIPYIPENGRYMEDRYQKEKSWWTNGFWGGILWQLYYATGREEYQRQARKVEEKMDVCLREYVGLHHDVGFMYLHTAVADYRITGREDSRVMGLHAANLLAGRYNIAGRFLRSWNEDHTGWVIIDSMMNIPLLYWASKESGDNRFYDMAVAHADTVLRNHLRPDGSCNHIVVFDPSNGEFLDNPGGQGYASGSAWTRGQAWGLYGFALSYHHTKEQRYLDAAKQIAHYFLANIARSDYVSHVDFRCPVEPVKYDTTASCISACGLLEIAEYVEEYEKPLYLEGAVKILKALDERFCNWNPMEDSIVSHGTASYHLDQGDSEKPIIYADYFYIEAILRLLDKSLRIWG